jgi:hypothetical protein
MFAFCPAKFGKERPSRFSLTRYHLHHHFESSRRMPWATDGLAELSAAS